MWNTPTKERLEKIPRLNETDGIPLKDKKIYLHFFIFGSDWYIAEYDASDRRRVYPLTRPSEKPIVILDST